MMSKLAAAEKAVEAACARGEIPGLVLAATDRSGAYIQMKIPQKARHDCFWNSEDIQ